jgi:uncharacterized membrane protein YczE
VPSGLHEPRALAEVDERLEAIPDTGWRASPAQLGRLLVGLWVFGTGEGLLVIAELGNSPWTVFAEGVGEQTGLNVGTATILVSFALLLLWIPLGERPGLGTIANAIVIGLAIDVTVALAGTPDGLVLRWALMLGGIGLVGVGSGLYINAALGRGPRDGLMMGLHRRTGRPIALVRAAIEITALVTGVLLGGLAGIGTVAFALLVGPAVAFALRVLPARPRVQAQPRSAGCW